MPRGGSVAEPRLAPLLSLSHGGGLGGRGFAPQRVCFGEIHFQDVSLEVPHPLLLDGEGPLELHLAEPVGTATSARLCSGFGRGSSIGPVGAATSRDPWKAGSTWGTGRGRATARTRHTALSGRKRPPGADLPALEGVDVTHKLHQGGLRRAGDQGGHRPHPRRRLARLLHLLLEVGPFLLPVQGVIQGPRLPPLKLCGGRTRNKNVSRQRGHSATVRHGLSACSHGAPRIGNSLHVSLAKGNRVPEEWSGGDLG